MLRRARRPLVIGMGGGGDIVGALATAEHARLYDGADPVLGGLTWERRPIDPQPGPRRVSEIAEARELAPGILLATERTHVAGREVYFAESRMAGFLGQPTVLIDIQGGPGAIADGLGAAAEGLGNDLFVFVDVGGDVLAHGDEPGLRSPLCDSIMLAVAARLQRAGHPVLVGIFGTGCDAELTTGEVLERLARVAAGRGLCGARGLTAAVAARVEAAVGVVPTEASATGVNSFRGGWGTVAIRGGERTLELSAVSSVTFYLEAAATIHAAGRLARAVDGAGTLEEANAALNDLGVHTELDLETEAARRETH